MKPFYTILTNYGKTALAEALAAQKPLEIPHMAVGDGGGEYYEPDEAQTNLRNERWRGDLNDLRTDEGIQGQVIAEAIIPHGIDGDWTAREIGLFDVKGGLVAVGKYPEMYIPAAVSGAKSQAYINIIIKVDNVAAVQLIVDHGQVLASKLFVKEKFVATEIPPSLPTVNNSSTKLLIKNTKGDNFSDYYVVTRKADAVKGYVAMGITNTAVTADGSNIGGSSPIRPSEVLNLSEVYVGYFQLYEKSATVTQTNFNRSTLQNLTGITGVLSGKLSLVNSLSDSETSFVNPQCLQLKVNDSVVYKMTKKAESIRFGMSNGSSDNVVISVSNDGINYKDINIVSLKTDIGKTGHCDIDLNMSTATAFYIKIRNESQIEKDVAYVFGVNVRRLEHCSTDTQFDSYLIASTSELDSTENKYQHGNGANEFAAHQKNGKWFGTYHGGHSDFLQRLTLSSRRYNVNTSYDELSIAELTDVVRLHSISNVTADTTTYKYIASTVWGDGVHITDYTLELVTGPPVLCDNAYTNMCTTSTRFNWVHHPILLEGVIGYQDINIGQTGFVEQFFAGSERTLKNYFTQVPTLNNSKNGAFIRFNATYNKVYYPLILGSAELFGGSFICCKAYS